MTADTPTILATSIGFDSRERNPQDWSPGPVFDFAFELAGRPDRPRLCFIGTATGDAQSYVNGVYSAFAGSDVRTSHLALFAMPNVADVRGHLLNQDVIWVGGGSVANLLAVWRTHGLEEILRECWRAGVVLGGVSAGSLCWHVGGTTDSFGPDLRPVTNGLALLPHSNGVHYDAEKQRRPLYHRLVADGHPACRLRHRQRCRPALPRHRTGRGGRRPRGRPRLPRAARSGRHRGGDPDRTPPAALTGRESSRAGRADHGGVMVAGPSQSV